MNRKSVFQRISKKISRKDAITEHDKLRRAFYCYRHYSDYYLKSPEWEKQLMRDWIVEHGWLEKRDSLNNADYWLIGGLFGLKDERSV